MQARSTYETFGRRARDPSVTVWTALAPRVRKIETKRRTPSTTRVSEGGTCLAEPPRPWRPGAFEYWKSIHHERLWTRFGPRTRTYKHGRRWGSTPTLWGRHKPKVANQLRGPGQPGSAASFQRRSARYAAATSAHANARGVTIPLHHTTSDTVLTHAAARHIHSVCAAFGHAAADAVSFPLSDTAV
jgi:hypothetical protein